MTDGWQGGIAGPWLKFLGWAATIAACCYFLNALWRLDVTQIADDLTLAAWWGTGAAAVGYGASLGLLAFAWLGTAASRTRPALALAMAIYGPAIVAKYLPGSIFQYASRQWRGGRVGLGQADMARASVVEAVLHVPAAAIVAALLLSPAGLFAVAALGGAGLVVVLTRFSGVVRAVGAQLAFFALFGLMIAGTAMLVPATTEPVRLAGWFLLAWIAGFLVPVAPGGIGVREAALVALAGGAPQIAVFAVLTRVITTAGDGLAGLTGYWLSGSTRSNRQASG